MNAIHCGILLNKGHYLAEAKDVYWDDVAE